MQRKLSDQLSEKDERSAVGSHLGKGDGTFPQAARTYPSPGHGMAVGDFNGDGILDLAGTDSLLLGNGDGTFQSPLTRDAGSGPNSVAVGDFNGDGKLDLVTTNYLVYVDRHGGRVVENDIRVYLGNGNGTFQMAKTYAIPPADSEPNFVVVGDFNGDGIPDLAVANGYGVSILLGNGDGTFQAAKNTTIATITAYLAVGDFNGDGHLDLAVASRGSLSVLLGNGDGTFQSAVSYTAGVNPVSVAVGDFNGDGSPDLAVANLGTGPSNTDGSVTVLLGNGDGTFRPAQSYAASNGPNSIVAADFNGDGILDLATSGYTSGYVSVLLGNGDGSFQAAQNYPVAPGWLSLVVGDFNGDGFPDLAANSDAAVILLNVP
jgi:hypothetical protein